MSNEITKVNQVRVAKGNLDLTRSSTSQITMTGDHMTYAVQSIGTGAHELLAIGSDVATAGVFYLRNLDATNYVEIGTDVAAAFSPTIKLKAGETADGRFATTAIYAKANGGTVKLEFWVLQD
jgi:hypothetical protein